MALCVLAISAGCSTVKQAPEETEPATPDAVEAEVTPTPPARPDPDDYPVAPFTKDALYQLLVAEVAGYRGQYDVALDKYVKAAIDTRDPGVAERATRLAAYLKRNDVALQTAQIWAQEDPDDIDAHRHAADQLMRVGDLEGAVKHLEAVKRLGGLADFSMFAYRAATLDEEGRKSLLGVISKMLDEFPGDDQLMFSKAVLLEQSGELDEALALADQLLADKQNINVIILKVNALKDLHRTDEALAFMKEAIGEMKENRRLRLIYARLLFESDKLDEAAEQYEIVHKQAPSDGDILFALALIAMEQGNDASARGYLDQMVRWNRRAGEAHFYLGSIAEKNGDASTALREYKQVGNGYEFLPAQSRIASLMLEEGKVDEARGYLESARAEHPERYDELVMVEAQLLSERGLEKPVFDLMDKAIARDPGNIDLLYFRAMTGEKFGHLDILERDLNKIIALDPDNADALNALGYTLTDRTDRHEEALKLIQRALEIKPDEAAFIDSLGWVMYRMQKFDKALAYLRKALQMFPNDEVAAHLGEVLWVVGKKTEANKVWENALELKPDSKVLKQVIQRFTGE
ncbi:MAG: tetratricopeptide repeat protein [Pseudomonadales bacterium]|nr:tetratricopeptide repeat protein [Pseudomonadales bacterium]